MVGSQQVPEPAKQPHRILIVEDEMLIAMELEALLQRHGCEVVGPVRTVARALALLDQEPPDAVLLDLNLKGESANSVAAALTDRGVPFVLVTGYGEAQASGPELQGAPRVEKPVDHRALMRTLASVLDARLPT